MDEKIQQTPEEQLLAEILDACMEEDLSFVPSDREIARMHTFSPEFCTRMEELVQKQCKASKKIRKTEFIYGFNKVAACILVLVLVGGLSLLGYSVLKPEISKEAAPETATVYEEAADSASEAPAPAENSTAASAEKAEDKGIPDVMFLGKKLRPAAEQELPSEYGNVKILVNSPKIARNAEEILVTIGNMEEYSIRYYPDMELEVQINGYWYQLPPREEKQESTEMVDLEAGMAQDEALLLTDYDLDYNAENYRIAAYLDDVTLGAVFQFEEEMLWEEKEP